MSTTSGATSSASRANFDACGFALLSGERGVIYQSQPLSSDDDERGRAQRSDALDEACGSRSWSSESFSSSSACGDANHDVGDRTGSSTNSSGRKLQSQPKSPPAIASARIMHSLTVDFKPRVLSRRTGPCLSLYQPTHRHHRDNQQDPVRFRNLTRVLAESLEQQYGSHDATAVLEPFRALATDGAGITRNPDSASWRRQGSSAFTRSCEPSPSAPSWPTASTSSHCFGSFNQRTRTTSSL